MTNNLQYFKQWISNNTATSLPNFQSQVSPLSTELQDSLDLSGLGWSNISPTSRTNILTGETQTNFGGDWTTAINNTQSSLDFRTPLDPLTSTKQSLLGGSSSGLAGNFNTGPTSQQQKALDKAQRKQNRLAQADVDADGNVSANEWLSGTTGGQIASIGANLLTNGLNTYAETAGEYGNRHESQKLNSVQQGVRSSIYAGLNMVPGWGQVASMALQLTDGLGAALGTQMSNIDKTAAEDAGISNAERAINNIVSTIPVLGSITGAFTGSTNEWKGDVSRVANIGSAYDLSSFDSAEALSGAKTFTNKKNNAFLAEQQAKLDTLTGISDQQALIKAGASSAAADYYQQNKNKYSGNSGGPVSVGKEGMKLENLAYIRELLRKRVGLVSSKNTPPIFKEGGKLGEPGLESNVIVEGAYHAHKNHLDDVNPSLSDMTPKGIPVTVQEEGEEKQVAEIERKELILTKELTEKIEALYLDGSDEAALEAGKLFAEELFNNTIDNTEEVLNANN